MIPRRLMWTTQLTHEGWYWWSRPYGKKILVTIVRVKKNWGNGKRTEDCKGEWQPVPPPQD